MTFITVEERELEVIRLREENTALRAAIHDNDELRASLAKALVEAAQSLISITEKAIELEAIAVAAAKWKLELMRLASKGDKTPTPELKTRYVEFNTLLANYARKVTAS